eukprot:gene4247-4667_t
MSFKLHCGSLIIVNLSGVQRINETPPPSSDCVACLLRSVATVILRAAASLLLSAISTAEEPTTIAHSGSTRSARLASLDQPLPSRINFFCPPNRITRPCLSSPGD